MRTVVVDLDECHGVAVTFCIGVDAIPIDSTLTCVLIVVGSRPEVALGSIAVVPPRLNDPVQFERGAKAVVLTMTQWVNIIINNELN